MIGLFHLWMEWGDPLTLAKKATSADGQKILAKIKQSKRPSLSHGGLG